MATNQQRASINPQGVRSHAHGKGFWTFLIAPWPIGVLLALLSSLLVGTGLAVSIGSGLGVALGINFVWVVIVFAIDDGDVNDRARRAEPHEDGRGSVVNQGPKQGARAGRR